MSIQYVDTLMSFKNNGYQFIFYQFHPKKYLQKQEAMDQTIQTIRRKTNSNNGIYVHCSKRNETIDYSLTTPKRCKIFNAKERRTKKHFYYFSRTIVVGSIFHLHRVELNRLKVNYIVRSYFILLHVFR